MQYIVFPIKYSHIFEEPPLSTEEYLAEFSKKDLILMVLHIVGINNKDSYSMEFTNFLKMYFQDFPNSSNLEFIQKKIRLLILKENLHNTDIVLTFAEPRAALLLLKDIILLPNGYKTMDSEDDYMRFLRAYLAVLEKVQVYKQNLLESIPDFENPLKRDARIYFSDGLISQGLTDYNFHEILVTQQMKALMLNEFINRNSQLKHVVDIFLQKKKVNSILDNLMNLLIIRVYEENKFKEGQISICRDDYKKYNDFFDRLTGYLKNICIDINELEEAKIKLEDIDDFSCYKQFPVIKINNDHYVVASQYFFALNIYDGMNINLRQISREIEDKDIRRLITNDFSEEFMFYKVIERLIVSPKNINISGKTFFELNDHGRPDYYIRNKKRILIFEYKDILMNKKTRNTDNFSGIEYFFKTRFNEKKGVPQIVKNIKDIFNQDFKLDKSYNVGNIQIYPILIVQDRLFSLNGTNYILNDMFEERIENEEVLKMHQYQINPLIVIDIDFLLILSLHLKKDLQSFIVLLHSYYKYIQNSDKFSSFRSYILNSGKIKIQEIDKKELIRHYFTADKS